MGQPHRRSGCRAEWRPIWPRSDRGAGRAEEAESFYRQAVDAGHGGAMVNLGVLLAETGRAEEAEASFRQAADAGHSNAMVNLGILLAKVGRAEEAKASIRRAADGGHTDAVNLGILG
ncbi:tetratricopeptide repeat protein [Streptomyces anulatus]|nr:tetratricopeptide repeat protein [Streptomyces anulatus]WTC67837.1 tetratricopeptide repeat protein [Streptomyces anulatus]WTC69054.1 tetratricopeptide repeat protein [Streptomyces anulatus]WUC91203.1 tetratricopeptide repeat protein [Streptomyces anulatus]WUD93492.1 tetratricopeptide repeat protein [Streptomyces anulatus]